MMQALKPPTPKQLKNEKVLKIYVGFLCLLIILVVVARWLQTVGTKDGCQSKSHGLRCSSRRACLLTLRKLERRVSWKWFGRPSFGLILLFGIYLIANVTLSSTTFALHQLNHVASRFGWLGAANMALCVFFGLKNTPLALVAAVSHIQLNTLHRIVGYTAVLFVLLHAALYTVYFGRQGNWAKFVEVCNLEGIGAGVAMCILLMGIFRHRCYKVFYASHIAGFIAAVVLTALHRPDWAKKLPVAMTVVACMWALDRIIRAAKVSYNLINNHVTFCPLPYGGTRLLLTKPFAKGALPGSHCFLWIPRLKLFQVHPFTIVSNGPSGLELVMKSHEGFTKDVHDFATQHPNRAIWVSIDGPYGSLPETAVYDKLVLIAGGSGAAFTFGLMNRILNDSERIKLQSVDFVWAVKRTEYLSWFDQHLQNLTRFGSAVNVKVYITDEGPDRINSNCEDISRNGSVNTLLSGAACEDVNQSASLEYKKLSAETVIWDAMQTVGNHEKVLVAACGPSSLMDAVRDSVDSIRCKGGHWIDVHFEDFGG